MASHDEANTTVAMIMKDHATERPTLDSAIPSPVSGRSHSRRIETNHPTSRGYWTDPARFMATPINQLIIPTETAGVFKQASKLNAEHKGRRPPGDRDDGEVHQPNTGGQKLFPPEDRSIPERE